MSVCQVRINDRKIKTGAVKSPCFLTAPLVLAASPENEAKFLFDRYRFGKVARMIDIAAAQKRDLVCKKLREYHTFKR